MNPLLEKDLALLRETQAYGRAGCLFPLSCMSKSEKRRGLKLRKAGYLEKGYTPATKQGYTLTVQGFEAFLEERTMSEIQFEDIVELADDPGEEYVVVKSHSGWDTDGHLRFQLRHSEGVLLWSLPENMTLIRRLEPFSEDR